MNMGPAGLTEELIVRGGRQIFPCTLLKPGTRRLCNATFCRASALKRHETQVHHGGAASTTFVFCSPGGARRRSIHTSSISVTSAPSSARHRDSPTDTIRRLPEPYPLNSQVSLQPSQLGSPFTVQQAVSNASTSSPSALFNVQGQMHLQSPNQSASALTCGMRCSHGKGMQDTLQSLQSPMHDNRATLGVPQASSQSVATCQAAVIPKPIMPTYDCRVSKQMPDQPKALKWLYEAAKLHFFADYEALLASWGLTLQHKGTCLLVPEAWRFSNPLHLMALFSIDSVPPPDSPRAWYSYADHATSLARAKVFFEKVQRKGEDLDIFLGYPDLPAMDASHLCHQEYCVIHLVYELAHINQDRNNCLKRAKFLRSQNMPIPEGCTAHNPSPMHDAGKLRPVPFIHCLLNAKIE